MTGPAHSSRVVSPHHAARRSVQGTSCMDASSAQTANPSPALWSFSGRRGRTGTAHVVAAASARIAREDFALKDLCRRLKGLAYRTSTSPSSTLATKSW